MSRTGPHDAVSVIIAKRDGAELTDGQIDWVVDAFTRGEVAPEQMSALAMAVCLNGMTRREIARWTRAMIASGSRLDLGDLRRDGVRIPTVDKHSTGGVGDKITLPLAPLVASYGVAVPQLSGRGLGHTGGTLDKLEAIPGWRAELTPAEIRDLLGTAGCVVCAPTGDLAPADRELYALRDVTGTVESIPLIAASIMSKKIAEGADAIVLDVKVGSGAFMKNDADALELARTMVGLGRDHGVATRALLTDMSTPLGRSAGNALEVAESVEVLAGGGPGDVVELVVALAAEMLDAVGITGVDPAENLANGRAMDAWRSMIAGQGGDPRARLPEAPVRHVVRARQSGVVGSLDAMAVGRTAWSLGAGRRRRGEPVSATAGVTWDVMPGDVVREGAPLLTLHADDEKRIADVLEAAESATVIGDGPVTPRPRILGRVGEDEG